jgi:hypothetical protein
MKRNDNKNIQEKRENMKKKIIKELQRKKRLKLKKRRKKDKN